MIEKLNELALKIDQAWSDKNQSPEQFSQISLEYINTFRLDLSLESFEEQLGQWIMKEEIPKQLNVYNNFGEPPVTIFNNGKFVLDIYFWAHVDTSLHSHSFSGSFKVLYGRSIHEVYKVSPKKIFAPDIMQTEIHTDVIELLEANDSREIHSGNQFNHRLIHLDNPTITLCARTIEDKEKSQWHHFYNGLSVEKKEMSEDVIKNLYFYQYLYRRDRNKSQVYMKNLVSSWSISTLLNLYERLSVDTMGIEEEAVEYLFNLIIDLHESSEWFKLYEDFYKLVSENFIELKGDTPSIRFMEHALNFKYPQILTRELLTNIQSHAPSTMQLAQIATLK